VPNFSGGGRFSSAFISVGLRLYTHRRQVDGEFLPAIGADQAVHGFLIV
jgi:hypothetical protein